MTHKNATTRVEKYSEFIKKIEDDNLKIAQRGNSDAILKKLTDNVRNASTTPALVKEFKPFELSKDSAAVKQNGNTELVLSYDRDCQPLLEQFGSIIKKIDIFNEELKKINAIGNFYDNNFNKELHNNDGEFDFSIIENESLAKSLQNNTNIDHILSELNDTEKIITSKKVLIKINELISMWQEILGLQKQKSKISHLQILGYEQKYLNINNYIKNQLPYINLEKQDLMQYELIEQRLTNWIFWQKIILKYFSFRNILFAGVFLIIVMGILALTYFAFTK